MNRSEFINFGTFTPTEKTILGLNSSPVGVIPTRSVGYGLSLAQFGVLTPQDAPFMLAGALLLSPRVGSLSLINGLDRSWICSMTASLGPRGPVASCRVAIEPLTVEESEHESQQRAIEAVRSCLRLCATRLDSKLRARKLSGRDDG